MIWIDLHGYDYLYDEYNDVKVEVLEVNQNYARLGWENQNRSQKYQWPLFAKVSKRLATVLPASLRLSADDDDRFTKWVEGETIEAVKPVDN